MSNRLSFSLIAQVVPGILVVLIGYLGCDIIFVLIIWFVAVTLITAGYAGAMANIVDIAPNFAGEYSICVLYERVLLEILSSFMILCVIFRTGTSIRTDNSYDRQFPVSRSSWSAYARKRKYIISHFFFKVLL